MMDRYGFLYVFDDIVIFLVFAFSNFVLLRSRYSAAKTAAVIAALTVAVGAVGAYLYFYVGESFALTQMPLTAYLPMIICVHILSEAGPMQTAAVWAMGLLEYFSLKFLSKLLRQIPFMMGIGAAADMVRAAVMLAAGLLIMAVLLCYVRKPFQQYVGESRISWIVPILPVFLLFLLFSYFSNAVTDPTVFLLLFFTAGAVLAVIYKLLISADRTRRAKEDEERLLLQMESQRRQYEEIRRKYEMGRAYRHDMRHHLGTLGALVQQSDAEEAAAYIRELSGRMDQIEVEAFCKNTAINAVLSFYIGKAREAGCKVEPVIRLPEELPFEETDLCVVLSNTLENAIHALEKQQNGERYIRLRASFEEGHKVVISVENPCERKPAFDRDGLPKADGEGHGIGLRSVKAVVQKYNGIFSCSVEGGVFAVKVVMFRVQPGAEALQTAAGKPTPRISIAKKVFQSMLLLLLSLVLSANMFPEAAYALEEIPGLGALLRIVTLERYHSRWGDTAIDIEIPTAEMTAFDAGLVAARGKRAQEKSKGKKGKALSLDSEKGGTSSLPKLPVNDPNLKDAVDDFNEKMADYIEQMKEKFLWYVARKYDGYVGLDTTYTILCNDEEKLILRFDTTLNAGGSGQYSRCFTMDKREKKVIELKDLFQKNASYVPVVSKEILKQMQVQVDSGTADYFIPGGIWREDEWFKEIDGDQNFYINEDGKLVIVFDEYEVAPGSMGCPEFVIPTAVIKKLLKSNSLIK